MRYLLEAPRAKGLDRIAIAYAVSAWVVLQAAATAAPAYQWAPWVLQRIILAALLGLPVVLIGLRAPRFGATSPPRRSCEAILGRLGRDVDVSLTVRRRRTKLDAIRQHAVWTMTTHDDEKRNKGDQIVRSTLRRKRMSRTKLPVSKAGGGVMPGIDLDNSAALQEMDDVEYATRLREADLLQRHQ